MHPKNIGFLGKTFLGCTFYIFEIIMKRRIFYTPFDLIKEKKNFHLLVGSVCTFYELKKHKMEATTQYFGKWFFYNQVLKFHCPSKFVCQTSGRQNHWSQVHSNGAWDVWRNCFFSKVSDWFDLISIQQSNTPEFVSKDRKCYKSSGQRRRYFKFSGSVLSTIIVT